MVDLCLSLLGISSSRGGALRSFSFGGGVPPFSLFFICFQFYFRNC
jgi:hypothetical protein